MRIVSDYKDFYDCMQSTSPDRDTLFVRKTSTETVEHKDIFPHKEKVTYLVPSRLRMSNYKFVDTHISILYMCGDVKFYIKTITRETKKYPIVEQISYMWNLDRYTDHYREADHVCYKNKLYNCLPKPADLKTLEDRLPNLLNKLKKYTDDTPILSIGAAYQLEGYHHINKFHVTRNPCLQNIAAYQVYSHMEVYQRVETWLYNKARPMKPIPDVSNEDMILAKGFDLKTSFRKSKSKK